MKTDKSIPEGLKVPSPLSCPECVENGERRIHWCFSQVDPPNGQWSWHVMNHDETSKFEWPASFDSLNEAKAHVNSILESATDGEVSIG